MRSPVGPDALSRDAVVAVVLLISAADFSKAELSVVRKLFIRPEQVASRVPELSAAEQACSWRVVPHRFKLSGQQPPPPPVLTAGSTLRMMPHESLTVPAQPPSAEQSTRRPPPVRIKDRIQAEEAAPYRGSG